MRTITLFAILVVIMMGFFTGLYSPLVSRRKLIWMENHRNLPANPNDENNTKFPILVEGKVAGNSETHNISLKINDATVILKKTEKNVNALFCEMKTGNNVAVMFTGPSP